MLVCSVIMLDYSATRHALCRRVRSVMQMKHCSPSLCSTALLGAGIADTRKMDGIQVLERGRLCMSSNRTHWNIFESYPLGSVI